MFDNLRNIVLLVLVVFIAILFGGFILGPVIAILYFLFQRYYRRSKQLEKQLAELKGGKTQTETATPTPSSVPPPPSTDA